MLGYLVHTVILWIFRRARPARATHGFRMAQSVSAAGMGLGHGLQDAQKTMGVIVLALVTAGRQTTFDVPWWVIGAVAASMAAGTYTLDHAHHHLRDPRRRRHPAAVRGALGHGPQHRHRLAADHARCRTGRGRHLRAHPPGSGNLIVKRCVR